METTGTQRAIILAALIGISACPSAWAEGSAAGLAGSAEPAPASVIDYTPSSLLAPGQIEIKLFNNLYSQAASFDRSGEKHGDGVRSSYFTAIASFLYGAGARWNLGVDFYVKSVRIDRETASAFSIFGSGPGLGARTALSSIAPKIKASPIESIPRLALQTALLVPAASDMEGDPGTGRPFLDYDAYQWWTQLFYDVSLRSDVLLYLEGGTLVRFFSRRTDFLTPAKAIFNYYPTRFSIVYALAELGPTWDGFAWSSYYSQVGLGGKYQLTSHLELETLFSTFPAGKTNGAGRTYNLGFRIIY